MNVVLIPYKTHTPNWRNSDEYCLTINQIFPKMSLEFNTMRNILMEILNSSMGVKK